MTYLIGIRTSLILLFFALSVVPQVSGISGIAESGSCTGVCAPHCTVVACQTDFSLTPNPTSTSIQPGQNAVITITGTPFNGFSDEVDLTAAVSTSGTNPPTTMFSSSAICVGFAANGTSCSLINPPPPDSSMTISTSSNTPNGDYTITVTGVGILSGLRRTTSISVRVPSPLAILPNPAAITVLSDRSENSTVSLESLFGSGGTAILTTSSPDGGTSSINPDTVTVPGLGNGDGVTTLTFGPARPGNYSIVITGKVGPFTSQRTIYVRVTDFMVTPAVSTTLLTGVQHNTTITVSSINGFNGPIQLSAKVSPPGPRISFSTPSLTLAAGERRSTYLSVISDAPGTYTVNITATSGGSSRSATANLTFATVLQGAPEPKILGLQPLHFYGILGAGITAAAIGSAFTVSRRKKMSTSPLLKPSPIQTSAQTDSREGAVSPVPTLPDSSLQDVNPPKIQAKPIKKHLPFNLPGLPHLPLPKSILDHKVPIALVAMGTGLVVAALATISPQAGLFGGLIIPGFLLLGMGSFILFLQLYQRPLGARRFCMYDGFPMSSVDLVCPSCHKHPPSDVDTKVCQCSAVIPARASYCGVCGAGQPKLV